VSRKGDPVTSVDVAATDRFVSILNRLAEKSVEDHYNPYEEFSWPTSLPEDSFWMSQDLMSTYGTPLADELDVPTLHRLSRAESCNFYSLNVHGIRELLIEVVHRIHMPGFEVPSAFFHHFVGEENQHMWFFAEFCLRYGRIYSAPRLKVIQDEDPAVENFLVFARILLFEEIVDFYNLRMAEDESLHETIRSINRIHHRDESRHIAFGRELVALLFRMIEDGLSPERRVEVEQYLKRYIVYSLHSFYHPQVYRDAGIPDPLGFRSRIIAADGRRAVERKAIRKPMSFLLKQGILSDDSLPIGVS
jgi:hypothetical protein